jgi:predicted AlkP superfamily phosphohydrolase/phosphomutase
MENYIVQSNSVFQESLKIFDYEFGRFLSKPEAMLFYYFSAIDQGSHIYWALRDPLHPYYHAEEAKRFGDQIEAMYREFDQIVGQVVKRLPAGIPLMILSDHGFAPLRRQLNLNALLHQNGFLKVVGQPDYSDSFMLLKQANWDNTQAYALGLNGLFINLRSREGNGIVRPEDKRKVMENIKNLLLSLKDLKTGENAVGKVFIPEDMYKGRFLDRGPDMIVGCNRGYGLDYLCATGGMSREIITDNLNRWSGDHIIDPHQVPAILMTNFKITDKRVPAIWDMAPTILDVFGIPTPTPMRGKSLI